MSATTDFSLSLSSPISGAAIAGREWSLEDSYRYCERLARSHYENFPVGSALVPKRLRRHFYSIYAFARTADDFADEGYDANHSEGERLDCLRTWLGMLHDCQEQRPSHPIFIALGDTIVRFSLPLVLFEDLLSAFSQDVTTRRYDSFDDLADYCRRSANPIGRLILLLFGHHEERLHQWSDDICTALQLANHWQDVRIDLDKDRIYLPLEDLAQFGVNVEDLKARRASPELRRLISFETERASLLFERGKPLCTAVRGRLGVELRAVWLGGMRILSGIRRNQYDVFNHRPVITGPDKLRILFGALTRASF